MTISPEAQQAADVEALRDLVHEFGTDEDTNAHPIALEYKDDNLELWQYESGGYRISVADHDEYTTDISEEIRNGQASMVLEFNADLIVTKAFVELQGERGGVFTKGIGSEALGSFVTKMLAAVYQELNSEKPKPDEPEED